MNTFENSVLNWMTENAPAGFFEEFKNTDESQLCLYHHSLGREIRNAFKLWEVPWEPKIVDGFDMSENHPDYISMRAIENIWKFLKNGECNVT